MNGRLRELRRKSGMTQEDLASRLGVRGLKAISAYETARRQIPYDVLLKLSKIFNVAPIDLATENGVLMTGEELFDWTEKYCSELPMDEGRRDRVLKLFELIRVDIGPTLKASTTKPPNGDAGENDDLLTT